MAIIPKDSKTNGFQDQNLGIEVISVLFVVYIFYDSLLSKYIISYLQLPFVAFMVLITAYLIMPSNVNKGKSGMQRLFIFLRFEIKRFKLWRSKRVWK